MSTPRRNERTLPQPMRTEYSEENLHSPECRSAKLQKVYRRSSFVVVLVLAFSWAGCSEVLGLGGLEFEPGGRQDDGSAGGAPGSGGTQNSGGGSSSLVVGAGGGGLSTDRQDMGGSSNDQDDFPVRWPQGVLIEAVIGKGDDSPYWFYDAGAEQLHSFQFDADQPDELGAQDWKGAWSHILAYESPEAVTLLGYDADLGFVSEVTGANGVGDLRELSASAGTARRTDLLTVEIGSESYIVVYSRESGSSRYFPSDSESEVAPCFGSWGAGWTQIVGFRADSVQGVLLFNSTTKILSFVSLEQCGIGSENDFSIELEVAPATIFSFPEPVTSDLFFYFESGLVERIFLLDSAQGMKLEAGGEEGYWREGLSDIVPLRAGGVPSAITYDARSGVAELRSLVQLEDQINVVVK